MSTSRLNFRPLPTQIKAARMLLEMTQIDLASAAGVAQGTLENYEAGHTVPQAATLEKIIGALMDRGITFTNSNRPTVSLDRSKAVIPG